MEIHVQLKTQTKMFCDCLNETWKIGVENLEPNKNVCPVCLGHPGTLPVANQQAIEFVIKAGLALNCQIADKSKFDRKNYFYPDLPKGYQISQYDLPLCKKGYLELSNGKIGITRIHLEEDTGKLTHIADGSLVDYNRAGVPLMELVSEPDITSGAQAKEFCQELQAIFRELNIADANMEKGQMRCEVNISLSNEPRIKTNESRTSQMGDTKKIVLKDESYKLMGLLFEIHTKLGSVYKEKNYQDAIEEVLKREKIFYEREKQIKVKFENLELSNLFVDFIIDNKILLEVKAKNFITNDDIRQTSRYIKSADLPLGIVVNFKREKLEYKRVINPAFENNSISFEDNSRKSLGTKVEIKNLNSFKAVERAIDYEINRQKKLLENNKKVTQETRGWNEDKSETFSQRIKEGSADYRYFPEPDLPPIDFSKESEINIKKIKQTLPELPQAKRQRFITEYGFKLADASKLVINPQVADYAEKVISELKIWLEDCGEFEGTTEEIWQNNQKKVIKLIVTWLINKLPGLLNAKKLNFSDNQITPENFAEFITLILTHKVSARNANVLLEKMLETGGDPSHILEDENLSAEDLDLDKLINEIINKNPDQVAQFKAGKTNLLKFFIGQVMKESQGKADPQEAEEILLQKLS